MTLRASDWTGSSSQRRPQGTCRPPTYVELDCDSIPAGTPVMVKTRRGGHRSWREHRTRIVLQITEILKRTNESVMFAHDEWVISVALKHIRPAGGKAAK